jgi:hypothetical protein
MPRYWRMFWKKVLAGSAIFWTLLFLMMCVGCMTPKATAIVPEGTIIEQDGGRFLIIWKDLGDKPHSYAYNWVYLPEMREAINIADYEAKIILQKRRKP